LEQRLAEIYEQGHLVAVHQTWIRINDFRETEMLANIYNYSKAHDFENAVFLVGAEHRKPIMDCVNNKVNSDQVINWDFQYFNQCLL
jgi:predicted ATP-grasp superfamily ATP-dependent carboligase